eukprot:7346950-Pyramimonas_sp.AAC.1
MAELGGQELRDLWGTALRALVGPAGPAPRKSIARRQRCRAGSSVARFQWLSGPVGPRQDRAGAFCIVPRTRKRGNGGRRMALSVLLPFGGLHAR